MDLQNHIEEMLAARVPEVEVLLAERPSPGLVRVYIDRDGGVDLNLCERVTLELAPLREQYALEVSSPGIDRPLVKPAHFRRFVGREVTVQSAEPLDGRRRFRGGLLTAGDSDIEIDQDGTPVRIPYGAIQRSRLVAHGPGGAR
jgi:ribosome maturation factor RimP